jgi:hypothetical protein
LLSSEGEQDPLLGAAVSGGRKEASQLGGEEAARASPQPARRVASPQEGGTVKKLQAALNLNVKAMLPGAAPPPRVLAEEPPSASEASSSSSPVPGAAAAGGKPRRPGKAPKLEHMTKDRAAQKGKRPPTRKGHKAAAPAREAKAEPPLLLPALPAVTPTDPFAASPRADAPLPPPSALFAADDLFAAPARLSAPAVPSAASQPSPSPSPAPAASKPPAIEDLFSSGPTDLFGSSSLFKPVLPAQLATDKERREREEKERKEREEKERREREEKEREEREEKERKEREEKARREREQKERSEREEKERKQGTSGAPTRATSLFGDLDDDGGLFAPPRSQSTSASAALPSSTKAFESELFGSSPSPSLFGDPFSSTSSPSSLTGLGRGVGGRGSSLSDVFADPLSSSPSTSKARAKPAASPSLDLFSDPFSK